MARLEEIPGSDSTANGRPQKAGTADRTFIERTADAPEIGHYLRRISTGDLLSNPALLDPPQVVLPYLAWEGRLTVLAGGWKSGKSTLTSQAVGQAVIANRALRQFLGTDVRPASVLWLALDEPLGDLWRRLYEWGLVEPGTIEFYDHERPTLERLGSDLAELRADLLVLDSLSNYARGLVTDVKQPTEWEALFSRLLQVTRPTNTSVLAIHHTPYGEVERPADSRQIGASADVVVTLTRPDKNDLTARKLTAIGRGVQYEHHLRYDGQGGFELGTGKPSLTIQIIELLRRGHGPGVRDIKRELGGDEHAIDHELGDLKKRLLVEVRPDGQRRRHYLTNARPELGLGGAP